MNTPITIEDVKRLVINPGEVLVVKLPANATQAQIHRISHALSEVLHDVKILFYPNDVEFMVVADKTQDEEKPEADNNDPDNYCGAV